MNASITIRVMRTDGHDDAIPLPAYATEGAAGADVRANFPDKRGISLPPGARALIPTGFAIEIPQGYEVQIRPRSGLALKHGIALVNAPGTIDSDYRGPVGVILLNTSDEMFYVAHGERIAQMVVAPVVRGVFEASDQLGESSRADGGFGSTGRT